MGEGMPVSYGFMTSIAQSYSDMHNGTPYGNIPLNMLYCDTRRGNEKYIWYNPPQKRVMYFVPKLNLENVEYHIPGVIYVADENSLAIYAFKGNIPTDETELFMAPFFNVSTQNICLGSAKLQKPSNPSFAELMEYWEKRFWLSEFSHLGGGTNPTKNNLVVVTKSAKDKPFDERKLIPLKTTLKDILR